MPLPVRNAAARERERRRREEEAIIETSSKRRKVDDNPAVVKREQSPPAHNLANLKTSGVFFVRYPSNCSLGEANWKSNREKCLRQEASKLHSLGVVVNRTLIRDDGLAFDWTSKIPLDPTILNRPSSESVSETPQLSPPSGNPNCNANSGVDLLGHALRDQTVRQSLAAIEPVVPPAIPNVTRLMNVDRSVTPLEISSDEHSEYPVVGVAVKNTTSRDDPAGGKSSPQEYRRLIPLDLRIYQQSENKPGYRLHEPVDRRRRRIEWIQKEIEKIEGYTGEKVIGYKYDRNVVVITLKTARSKNTPVQTINSQPGRSTPTAPKSSKKMSFKASKQDGRVTNNTSLQEPKPIITHPPPKNSSKQVLSLQPPKDSESQPRIQSQTQTQTQPGRIIRPLPPRSHAPPPRPPSPSHDTPVEIPSSLPVSGPSSNVTSVMSKPPPVVKLPAELPSIASINGGPNAPVLIPSSQQDIVSTTKLSNPSDTRTVESRGLQFLERYLMLYDTDRKGLTSAFTPNATFSLRDDAKGSSVQVITNPSAIGQTIQKLDDALHHSIKGSISYEMTNLDDVDSGAILLTCDGTIVPRNHSHAPTHSFSRIFVLRRNSNHDRDMWPLKIASEKLILKRI
ncbi:hypothetical protein Clacol_009232 [Clathrus columnatus]|uniref:NTF2 domain-containing protein n=1 Tax=Clathrus columnatus TaxID=1419009 RepID=A0AAV5AMF3_9AGAM|nr:hypothetical protein Clacol_009232 [Clathrus columnatus]